MTENDIQFIKNALSPFVNYAKNIPVGWKDNFGAFCSGGCTVREVKALAKAFEMINNELETK